MKVKERLNKMKKKLRRREHRRSWLVCKVQSLSLLLKLSHNRKWWVPLQNNFSRQFKKPLRKQRLKQRLRSLSRLRIENQMKRMKKWALSWGGLRRKGSHSDNIKSYLNENIWIFLFFRWGFIVYKNKYKIIICDNNFI